MKTTIKVQREFEGIRDGAGWATDDYIINFAELDTDKERYTLMLKMASAGMLFDEEKLTRSEAMGGPKPTHGRYTVKQVHNLYPEFS